MNNQTVESDENLPLAPPFDLEKYLHDNSILEELESPLDFDLNEHW
jgi:hypothetical protein